MRWIAIPLIVLAALPAVARAETPAARAEGHIIVVATRPTLLSVPGRDVVDGYRAGFGFRVEVLPVAFGVARVGLAPGYSETEGFLFSADVVPVVELAPFVDDRLQVVAQAGAIVSLRTATATQPFAVTVGPYGAFGVRAWLWPFFGAGVFAGAWVAVGDDLGAPGWTRGVGELAFELMLRP